MQAEQEHDRLEGAGGRDAAGRGSALDTSRGSGARRTHRNRNGRTRYSFASSFQPPIARPASYTVTCVAPTARASARARLRRMAGAYVSG